jgi:hypothetical protein
MPLINPNLHPIGFMLAIIPTAKDSQQLRTLMRFQETVDIAERNFTRILKVAFLMEMQEKYLTESLGNTLYGGRRILTNNPRSARAQLAHHFSYAGCIPVTSAFCIAAGTNSPSLGLS